MRGLVTQPWQWPMLFGAGLVAGFVDSIAGGGGLITMPAMLSLGGDPALTLGTNKLQAVCGSGTAAWHYSQAGLVSWHEAGRAFGWTILGAAAGTLAVQQINPLLLKRGIPILLFAVAAVVFFKPDLGSVDRRPRVPRTAFEVGFGLLLGFYDGFFGPGAGTFWTMAFVLCLGFNLTKATGWTKVVNFGSNLASIVFFLWRGNVDFAAGLTMGAGQIVGARLGSREVLKRGARFIRPVFLTMVMGLTVWLTFKAFR